MYVIYVAGDSHFRRSSRIQDLTQREQAEKIRQENLQREKEAIEAMKKKQEQESQEEEEPAEEEEEDEKEEEAEEEKPYSSNHKK